ncbi:MAG: hypothetical protein WCP12_16115 [bacterium]
MVTFTVKAKVIGKLNDELITWKATVKQDGSKREAGEMRKVFCTAIIENEMAVLRWDMRKHTSVPVLVSGDELTVNFGSVSIENDITQINVLSIIKK